MTVTTGYVRMMTAYNAEMNRRLYAAAGRLDDAARRVDRGAFWRSIHGTLAHLVWSDRQWMSRFDGSEKNAVPLAESGLNEMPFEQMRADRAAMDARLEDWAARVPQEWLDGEIAWYSGAAKQDMVRPLSLVVPHFFNHQTHHRGQVHAMLTAAGEATGDTDLWLIV